MATVIEWTYNREFYVINRHEWLKHYMILCNEEVKKYKKKKNG